MLVLSAGYCGCHSPTAPGILHLAGHRVGMILPMLVGREEGEMVGLYVGMESELLRAALQGCEATGCQ